jgi:radical SAM protein with 4Fe4S-binding SPASM domain
VWFEQYNKDLRELVADWVAEIERTRKVPRLYPFLGVMESLLTGKPSKLRCGAGWIMFNIQTDGKITPCPVMSGMKTFYLGDIWQTDPRTLLNAVSVGEPCSKCPTYWICGGRCLYANATKLWGDEGYRAVCATVDNLVNSLEEVKPRVTSMIAGNLLSAADFTYPRYNSCEIIP